MPRRRLPTDWKDKLLFALEQGHTITEAARHAGISRRTVYRQMNRSPRFREQIDEAIEAGTDRLEDMALKRAEQGSDTLLMFLLKARRPEKFREHYTHQHSFAQEYFNALERAIEALAANPGEEPEQEPLPARDHGNEPA